MKNAYVYVDSINFSDITTNAVGTPFNGSTIYIYPSMLLPKTCNICGAHTHSIEKYDDKNFVLDKNNRKIFSKRLIQRKGEKIAINNDHKTKFSHVITLNTNKERPNEPQPNNRPHQQSTQYNCG